MNARVVWGAVLMAVAVIIAVAFTAWERTQGRNSDSVRFVWGPVLAVVACLVCAVGAPLVASGLRS